MLGRAERHSEEISVVSCMGGPRHACPATISSATVEVRQATESGEWDRSHHSRAGNLIWSQRIYTFVSEPFDADPSAASGNVGRHGLMAGKETALIGEEN